MQTVRNPPPRVLAVTETLHSLNHWKTHFRTYYRRDGYYKGFLLPDVTWNSTRPNYGQTDDVQDGVIVRTALDKSEDLKDFLNTIVGYLPFPYLTEKIVSGTTSLQQVWDIIYEHYGLKITNESLLDYVSIQKLQGESYRQFFDRMLSHARLHLPPAGSTADGIITAPGGEQMSIGLMNMVAINWLQRIHPLLVDIVRIEYSAELRGDVQLAALVPRIANNVDSMFAKHNISAGIDVVTAADDSVNVNKIKPIKQRTQQKTNK